MTDATRKKVHRISLTHILTLFVLTLVH